MSNLGSHLPSVIIFFGKLEVASGSKLCLINTGDCLLLTASCIESQERNDNFAIVPVGRAIVLLKMIINRIKSYLGGGGI
jgi:hypothetical protein